MARSPGRRAGSLGVRAGAAYAFIGPLPTSGENTCQYTLSAQPISRYSSITGSGTVTF